MNQQQQPVEISVEDVLTEVQQINPLLYELAVERAIRKHLEKELTGLRNDRAKVEA